MTWAPAPPVVWWLVATVAVGGLLVGGVLAARLRTGGYRLDHENGPLPPSWVLPVATAVGWAVLAWRIGPRGQYTLLPALLTFAAVAVALAWIDIDVHRLPTGLVRPATVLVAGQLALSSLATGDWAALTRAAVCAVALLVVFLLLALLASLFGGGFGLGDVQLAALLGLTTGYVSAWGPVVTTYGAFLLGGLFALSRIIARRADRRTAIAFGPWMLLGAYLALLVQVSPLF